jgi:DNA-directed RNA polymerase specialized sigma24 family protein
MYIRLHDILTKTPDKEIQDIYIFMLMRSIYLTQQKRNTKFLYVEDYHDYQLSNEEPETLEERRTLDNCLSKLGFYDREVLLKTNEISLRKLSKQIGCNHQTVANYKNKAFQKLKKIWQENQEDLEIH